MSTKFFYGQQDYITQLNLMDDNYNLFKGSWYGPLSADPSLDPLGGAPTVGDTYFNTVSNQFRTYTGTVWQYSDINMAALAASGGGALIGNATTGGSQGSTMQAAVDNKLSTTFLSKSVAGSSNVTLSVVEAGNFVLSLTGTITGSFSVIVPSTPKAWVIENATSGAFTVNIRAATGTGIIVTQGQSALLVFDGTNVIRATSDFPSVALTGVSTAPTAALGTNTTQIANTAFVQAAITALINGAPGALDTLKELADAINDDASFAATITTALALKAPLASPTLTGTPTAPTATAGTNTTQLASTAFVQTAVASIVGGTRVGGLSGVNNATTPTTKFDLSANLVVLKNSSGNALVVNNTGTVTLDFGSAGSVANGRDQALAFTASSWIHMYWIYNTGSSTLALLASATVPTSFTGSTLPSGYTYWCYATTVRWNASSHIEAGWVRGNKFYYVADLQPTLGSTGTNTTSSVDMSVLVPPNSVIHTFFVNIKNNSTTAATDISVFYDGSIPTNVRGWNVAQSPGTGAQALFMQSGNVDVPNISQQLYWNSGTNSSAVFSINSVGYTVPNGDVG